MNEVYLRIYKDAKGVLVAVCDWDVIGQTFRQGKLKLEVKSEFYKGSPAAIPDAIQAVNTADVANLVGEKIVEAAIREGLVDSAAVVRISGIPHVQIVKL